MHYSTRLHGITSCNTVFFIFTAVRISNITCVLFVLFKKCELKSTCEEHEKFNIVRNSLVTRSTDPETGVAFVSYFGSVVTLIRFLNAVRAHLVRRHGDDTNPDGIQFSKPLLRSSTLGSGAWEEKLIESKVRRRCH